MRCHFSLLTCSFLPGQEQLDIAAAVLHLRPHLLMIQRRSHSESLRLMRLPQRMILLKPLLLLVRRPA
jgi:hypothetical protein